ASAQRATHNVAAQLANADSLLNWYRALVQLRRGDARLRDGAYWPVDAGNDGVFAFARRTDDGAGIVFVLNMTGAAQAVRLSGLPDGAAFDGGVVVRGAGRVTAPMLALPPYGVAMGGFTSAATPAVPATPATPAAPVPPAR
ncbi:MAG: DUF3459 domain-containing protein, partial [Sphingopyxis sp.]